MTSEILILNNKAIVMAADSAVTVGGKKTYNGVNKLFMLSNNPPMGIMIFGSAEFNSIPLETLIKEYRKQTDFEKLGDIIKIKESFIDYLGKTTDDTNFSNWDYELKTFKNVVLDLLKEKSEKEVMNHIINSSVNMEIFPFLKEEHLEDKFEKLSQELCEKGIEVDDDILKKYFSAVFAFSSSGVVIAGFNENEFFPSYVSFNLIAKQKGKIITHDIDSECDYNGPLIVPFAQKDVINTFIAGIEDNLETAIIDYFYRVLETYPEELVAAMKDNKKINGKDLNNAIREVEKIKKTNENRMNEFVEYIDSFKKDIYLPILGSINVLPKDELASMAESMIHITSLKRKIASDLETVGGDIDVAIISKGDGFIWKKRKHYFKSELNPHFFDKE
ncbi:hypothetical protein [uncultured Methanobrevibacter sp.]|uniref:hypothetical protein n=1 Tax=uncultured Methanobrevibacter sp. TaxID=253161 RepID=UPI0026DFF270|nr:hypothetical protein [uncultured Methanobrevibacter sp.]